MKLRKVTYKEMERIPQLKVNTKFKQHFQGATPAPFIGRHNYPNINVGFLSPQKTGEMKEYDSPTHWREQKSSIGNIASKRYDLVNSRKQGNVKILQNRFVELVQEVGMAKREAEVEVSLTQRPTLPMKVDTQLKPFGPGASLQKARVTSNVKVDTRIEKVVRDSDLKASSGLVKLYSKGFEESQLHGLLSVGTLGVGKNRKLVPTRWSVTATDDTITKELLKKVRDLPIGDNRMYFGGGWGNYYVVMLFEDIFSYELFETYLPQKAYSSDYESFKGRTEYASNTAGGYYAPRLAVAEKMVGKKRQNTALVLRFITDEYKLPLGVWVCRESARIALSSKGVVFATREEMMSYVAQLVQDNFGFDVQELFRESVILKEKKVQRRLGEF